MGSRIDDLERSIAELMEQVSHFQFAAIVTSSRLALMRMPLKKKKVEMENNM